jgi:CheY-like chemotaxis protein
MDEQDMATVLLVESENSLRRVVSASLEQLGLRVLDAQDAEAAQEILENEQPELLIVEDDSPEGRNGEVIDAFRKQVEEGPNPVVVTATQRIKDEWRKRYEPEVAVYKPFDVRHLARVVAALIDARDEEHMELSALPGVVYER